MKKLILSALIIGAFCAPANAGPARKLAARLGISVREARQILNTPKVGRPSGGGVVSGGGAVSGGSSVVAPPTPVGPVDNIPPAAGGGAVGAVHPLNLRF